MKFQNCNLIFFEWTYVSTQVPNANTSQNQYAATFSKLSHKEPLLSLVK